MWHEHDGMGWWMLFGGILWLLFWASIIWLFFVAITRRDHGHTHHEEGDPILIARRRLARGDITTEQFKEIVAHLQEAPRSPP
jgi:uncharacterized membrane protein